MPADALAQPSGCVRGATPVGRAGWGPRGAAGERVRAAPVGWECSMRRCVCRRVRRSYHIQAVNYRHQRWKVFLGPCRRDATQYLDSYLRWFQ